MASEQPTDEALPFRDLSTLTPTATITPIPTGTPIPTLTFTPVPIVAAATSPPLPSIAAPLSAAPMIPTPTHTATPTNTPTPTATPSGDNTLTLQPNDTAGVDTRLASNQATANFGADDKLYVGESNQNSSVHRSLLRFDLSGIPANATITSATLSLWLTDDFSDNAGTFNVYRVRRAWTEDGATWNAAATGSNWNTPGLDLTTDAEGMAIALRAMTAGEAIPRPPPLLQNRASNEFSSEKSDVAARYPLSRSGFR